jgi:hypothetical protein
MMDKIKNPVPGKGSGYKPKIPLESKYRHRDFHSTGALRSSYRGERT